MIQLNYYKHRFLINAYDNTTEYPQNKLKI